MPFATSSSMASGSRTWPRAAAWRRRPTTACVDVTGLLVTPGLIDLHGHWYDGSPYGIDPVANLAGGVTTAVDAGTTGFSNFASFRRHTIEAGAGPGPGLPPRRGGRPRQHARRRAARPALRPAARGRGGHRRESRRHRRGEGPARHGAVRRQRGGGARRRARGRDPRRRPADGPHLGGRGRPGGPRADAAGRRRDPCLHRVGHRASAAPTAGSCRRRIAPRERGVRFDIGHGCGSFSWEAADQALAEGLDAGRDQHRPPSLLDRTTGRRPADDHVAVPRARHVARRGRQRRDRGPAAIVGRPDLGTLRAGGPADVDGHAPRRRAARPARCGWRPPHGQPAARGGLDDGRRRAPRRRTRSPIDLRPLNDADREVDCSVPI